MAHNSNRSSFLRLALGLLMAIAVVLAGAASPAVAQDDYTSAPTATIAGSLGAGANITVEGTGQPGDPVLVKLDGVVIASGVVGPDSSAQFAADGSTVVGTFKLDVTIPDDLADGLHEITVEVGGTQVASSQFCINCSQTTPTTTGNSGTGSLPKTGADNTLGMTQVGVALLAGGGLLLLARRRSAKS